MIDNTLQEYQLETKKILPQFIKKLDYGFALDSYLCEFIRKTSGNFYTFASINIDQFKLYNISTGGIVKNTDSDNYNGIHAKPTPNIDEFLVDYILSRMSLFTDSFAIFEDAIPSYGKQICSKVIELDNEIYHLITNTSDNFSCVNEIVDEVMLSWHFTCVLGFGMKMNNGANKVANIFQENICYIIIGAYDGEGFIVWRNRSNGSRKEEGQV